MTICFRRLVGDCSLPFGANLIRPDVDGKRPVLDRPFSRKRALAHRSARAGIAVDATGRGICRPRDSGIGAATSWCCADRAVRRSPRLDSLGMCGSGRSCAATDAIVLLRLTVSRGLGVGAGNSEGCDSGGGDEKSDVHCLRSIWVGGAATTAIPRWRSWVFRVIAGCCCDQSMVAFVLAPCCLKLLKNVNRRSVLEGGIRWVYW
jgi:hypothetical protein